MPAKVGANAKPQRPTPPNEGQVYDFARSRRGTWSTLACMQGLAYSAELSLQYFELLPQ